MEISKFRKMSGKCCEKKSRNVFQVNCSPRIMNEIISGFFSSQSIGYQSVGKIKSLAFPIEWNYEFKSRKLMFHFSSITPYHLPAERDVLVDTNRFWFFVDSRVRIAYKPDSRALRRGQLHYCAYAGTRTSFANENERIQNTKR